MLYVSFVLSNWFSVKTPHGTHVISSLSPGLYWLCHSWRSQLYCIVAIGWQIGQAPIDTALVGWSLCFLCIVLKKAVFGCAISTAILNVLSGDSILVLEVSNVTAPKDITFVSRESGSMLGANASALRLFCASF